MTKMSRLEKFFVNRRGEGPFKRLLSEMEDSGVVRIGSSSRLLELGGGKGTFSALLFEKYHPKTIFLTDYDKDQVNLARNKLINKFGKIPDNIILQQADASNLGYENGSFDVVIARLILHHTGGLMEMFGALNEIHRVLAPNGVFVYVEFAHKEELRRHLTDSGFSIKYRSGFHDETVIAVKDKRTTT